MCGMQALPYICDLARKADTVVPYATIAYSEYGDAVVQTDSSLEFAPLGLKAAPPVAANISAIAKKSQNVPPLVFGIW